MLPNHGLGSFPSSIWPKALKWASTIAGTANEKNTVRHHFHPSSKKKTTVVASMASLSL